MEQPSRRAPVNPVASRTLLVMLGGLAAIATVAFLAPGATAATGGPDVGGYQYIDNASAGGPTYSWTALAPTFTDVTDLVAGDESTVADVGFTFNFYGSLYTQVAIHENGFLAFVPSEVPAFDDPASWEPVGIPNAANPNHFIAGLMVDMDIWCNPDLSNTGTVRHQLQGTAPNRVFVTEWAGIPIFNGPNAQCALQTVTFQVRLLEAGNQVLVIIDDASYKPCGATVCTAVNYPPNPEAEPVYDSGTMIGIEEDGTTVGGNHGLQYFFQDYGVTTVVNLSDRAILFYRNVAPAAVSPGMITLNENCSATASTVQCPTASGAPFTLQGTDADGNSLTFCLDTAPTQGTLETAIPLCPAQSSPAVAPSGTPSASNLANKYIPTGNNCNDGATIPLDTLVFRVKDASLSSPAATVSFSITCINDTPATTTPHTLTVLQDAAAESITLTGADVDLTMITDTLSWCVVAAPANGVITDFTTCPTYGANLGSYAPNAGYCNSNGASPDTFNYKVKDAAGLEATGVVSVTVTCSAVTPPPPPPPPVPPGPNQSPKAYFGMAPSPARVGETVSFQEGSTDPDAGDAVVQWRWKFGDGSTSTERNPTHAYGATGSFQVCLLVADLSSAWSKSFCSTLQVNSAADAQAPPPAASAPVETAPSQQTSSGTSEPRQLSVVIDGPSTAAPGDRVTLVAHADGSPATAYAWQQLAGDAVVTVSGAAVTFTVPALADSLFFAVTATDGADQGTVTRLIAVDVAAEPVVAHITGPTTGRTGEIVSLDASGSEDATSFQWVQVSGPAITMERSNTATPLVDLGQPGTVVLMLAADNGQGATTMTHTIVVTLASAGSSNDGTSGQEGADSGQSSANDPSGDSDEAAEASVNEKPSGGTPTWLPYAIVGFIAAFAAVGAILIARRRA